MAKAPDFDVVAAHRYFAAYCFNSAWDLIEKEERTAQEDQAMVALSQASIFHWSRRADCDDEKMSIGYWQASRVQSLIGNPAEALRLGEICLSYSKGLRPFFVGYAHETLARAHAQQGRHAAAAPHLAAAREQLDLVKDAAARDRLAADLREIDGEQGVGGQPPESEGDA
jgi:hypothetical protein